VDVLDVGQGLSVLVQTKDKALLYDSGAKFSQRFDIGQRVVVPYLNYIGLQQLDILMISHRDNDHAGGADSVMQLMNVQQLLAQEDVVKDKSRADKADKSCEAGQSWVWNGVNFEVLYSDRNTKKSNNRSCVLKVWNEYYSLLLPGDIESKVEQNMLKYQAEKLTADVLLMPHHGSNTSSSKSWLEKLKPQLAIASAAYKNRFGHPRVRVVKRYHELGSRVLNTANSGMIQIKLPASAVAGIAEPLQHRKVSTHYWNHRF